MTLRQKYLKILSTVVPAGAVGISLLLGSAAPGAASQDPGALQRRASDQDRVSERLAAIRDAVSTVAGETANQPHGNMRFAWWRNWGWGYGWGRPWGGWGWPNWNNWHNWHNWNNWWRNW